VCILLSREIVKRRLKNSLLDWVDEVAPTVKTGLKEAQEWTREGIRDMKD
jgi:peptide subunit release factor 1 (eRF1)